MEQFSIYEGYMDELKKKITRIEKKCKRFGCDFHFAEVGEEYIEVKVDEDEYGKPITDIRRFVLVETEGTALVNGWQFVGSVEYTEKGNIFSKALSDVEIPERYRHTACICEHCNSNRRRKDTFIVMNTETGEFKQVGRQCLNDFTHGLTAEGAAWFMSLKAVFQEYEERPVGGSGSGTRYFPTVQVLQYAAETIRHFGYAKTDSAESTRGLMTDFMNYDMRLWRMSETEEAKISAKAETVGFDAKSEAAAKMVDEALAWVNGQDASNDYMHNLKTACDCEYTHFGRFGILVSLFPTYNRELEYEAQRREAEEKAKAERKSEHQGKVGDRIDVAVESVNCLTSWTNNYGYYGSTTYLWKLLDTNGNVYIWKTDKWMDSENPPKALKGTVKEHSEFREVKQTVLTRCKI